MLKTYRKLPKYEDIIHLPHPISKRHPQMGTKERAAQFAPFAALTGHGAAIEEAARVTEAKRELAEDVKERLDEMLERMTEGTHIRLTYIYKDSYKEGGSYKELTGKVRRLKENTRTLILDTGVEMEIPLEDIYEIKISQQC